MYEIGDYIRQKRKLSTGIQKGNTCYYLVGSMPIELTHEKMSGFSLIHASNTWPTLQEAIGALLSIGITEFQLPDCSWYHQFQAAK